MLYSTNRDGLLGRFTLLLLLCRSHYSREDGKKGWSSRLDYNVLTSATAVEVGQYSEEEGGGNGDGVSTLL